MAQAFNKSRLSHEEARALSDKLGEVITYKPYYPDNHEIHTVYPNAESGSSYATALKYSVLGPLVIFTVSVLAAFLASVLA